MLNSNAYTAALPGVVEAIFVPINGLVHHSEGGTKKASELRKSFLGRYWSNPPLKVPLLTFDVEEATHARAPFACIEGCA